MDAVKIRNRLVIRALARGLTWGFRTLYRSCNVIVCTDEPLTSPMASTGHRRYLYCGWHDGLLSSIFAGRQLNCAALTSRHADGEYVAAVVEACGMQPIRGSAGNGGASATVEMLNAARDHHVFVTTDGPRGPRRKVKPGIVFLASHSGSAIVPIGCSAVHAWRPRGRWTDLLIPKPFTTAYVLAGPSISVPPKLSKREIIEYCRIVQEGMNEMQRRADALAGYEPPADLLFETAKPTRARAA